MKNRFPLAFFAVYFSFTITSNFVHPITPAFLQSINCPSYMSGMAFSAMSFTAFLMSPFWGRMGDRRSYSKLIAFGYFGYAIGQLVFSMATNSAGVLFGRILSGFSSAALSVNSLAYLVSVSDPSTNRSKYLAIFAALQSVGSAMGYLIGGLIGDYSIMLVFYIQIACVALCALVCLFVLRDGERTYIQEPFTLRDVNPLSSMVSSFRQIDYPMMVFLSVVFFASFGMMAHDNYFNYFLKDQLGFPPSGNGYFKAAIGVIAIVANSTINMWITRHTDVRRSNVTVLMMCSVSLMLMVSIKGVPAFLISALVYYTFSVILLPVLQVLVMQGGDKANTGVISGLFNAILTFGKAAGPMVAGMVYDLNPLYPFWLAAVAFLLAAVLGIYNNLLYRKKFAAQETVPQA